MAAKTGREVVSLWLARTEEHSYNRLEEVVDAALAAARDEAAVATWEEAARICDQIVEDFRTGKTTPKWTATEAARVLRDQATRARRSPETGGTG